jgi:hypothetical protein
LSWVGTNGTTTSSSLFFLGKPLKILRTKLKILELHQNKFENPQILKQYPNIIFPHVKPPKWQEENWKFWNLWSSSEFQISKTKNAQNSQEQNTPPPTLHMKKRKWGPPKWQEENWRPSNFKKTKIPQN